MGIGRAVRAALLALLMLSGCGTLSQWSGPASSCSAVVLGQALVVAPTCGRDSQSCSAAILGASKLVAPHCRVLGGVGSDALGARVEDLLRAGFALADEIARLSQPEGGPAD